MAVHVVPHSLAPALRREGRRGAEGGSASGPCALLAQSEASNTRVTRDIHAYPQTCPRQLGPQRRPNLGGPSLPESPGQAARCGQTSDGRSPKPPSPCPHTARRQRASGCRGQDRPSPNLDRMSCCSSRLEKRILGFSPLMLEFSQGGASRLGLSRGSTSTSRLTWNRSGYFS